MLLGILLAAPNASAAITINGNAYTRGNSTVWAGCTGASNIGIAVNGTFVGNTSCAAGDGSFSFTGINTAANQVIAIYFNTNGGDRGVAYTRPVNNSTDIAGIRVFEDEAVLGSETATGWTNANLETWDDDNDADVPLTITGTTMTAPGETRIRVDSGASFTPTGTVTIPRLWIEGTYNGAPGETLTFTRGGDSACSGSSSMSNHYAFCNSGTFNAPPITRITSTTTTSLASGATYQTLSIEPTSGSPTINLGYSWNSPDSFAQTLVVGTGSAAVVASAQENKFTVTGNTTINALATINTENGGTFEANGNVTGAGATGQTTGGTFRMRPGSGATVLFAHVRVVGLGVQRPRDRAFRRRCRHRPERRGRHRFVPGAAEYHRRAQLRLQQHHVRPRNQRSRARRDLGPGDHDAGYAPRLVDCDDAARRRLLTRLDRRVRARNRHGQLL